MSGDTFSDTFSDFPGALGTFDPDGACSGAKDNATSEDSGDTAGGFRKGKEPP